MIEEATLHEEPARDDLPGSISLVWEDGAPVLRLVGEVDCAVVAAYRQRAVPGPAAGDVVSVVDAAAVTFLDCGALAFLIAQTRAVGDAGRLPVLCRPSRIVRRVLGLTGADALFRIAC